MTPTGGALVRLGCALPGPQDACTTLLKRHKGGRGLSFVVELRHELVKVAQVEDDRHESLVYFDAFKKQRLMSGPPGWAAQ